MTKQSLLVVLGGASLLGLLLTWHALESAPRAKDAQAAPLSRASLPSPPAGAEEPMAERREAAAPDEPRPLSAEQVSGAAKTEAALDRALTRLGVVLDDSLDGRLDPGAILDAALLVADREVGNPRAELDPAGRLLLPVEGLPEGIRADLCVSEPNVRQEKVLTLAIHLDRMRPFVFENWEREGPSVQVTTWTNEDGDLLHLSLLTDVQPGRRTGGLAEDPPRFTHGAGLYTPMSDPSNWKLSGSGMLEVEGSRQVDGSRSYRSASWEVPQVLEGGRWPRLEDMRGLTRRMLASHAAAKARTQR